jgi:Ni/Co efflux regulator RcnB
MKLISSGIATVLALAVGATAFALEKHDHDRDDSKHGRHDDWNKRDHRREHDEHFERFVEHREHHHRRIPEEHFRAHFGREHWFVISRPVIVAGHPRFRYDGYWFVIGRPLPPGWRYTDRVYVDYYEDNYYMCSPVHPGVRISINIL